MKSCFIIKMNEYGDVSTRDVSFNCLSTNNGGKMQPKRVYSQLVHKSTPT